ncbi:coiled-coil domain-containing protein 39 [Caerostris extrusa]|uniref:Coiled-coil domain-containing protein 39 n=1 Tax=Caerostris extrusa TaxID=172846 RepID=A0AAV4RVP6_CAEEX|nr:coiled-coil domain-containing protein 39 [Caerostris extrusa]
MKLLTFPLIINGLRRASEVDAERAMIDVVYKIILDTLGISEPGKALKLNYSLREGARTRQTIGELPQNDEELSALKNTVWLINVTNDQFRQSLHPAGISPEDAESLKNAENEGHALTIQLHTKTKELKILEESIRNKTERLEQKQNFVGALREAQKDREGEREALSKELSDLSIKIKRAVKNISRLSLEDIRIHLLREVRRTVSDFLFSAAESMPEIAEKIQELYQEANLPFPSRARSSISFRPSSSLSFCFRMSTGQSTSSGRSLTSEPFTPPIINLGSL